MFSGNKPAFGAAAPSAFGGFSSPQQQQQTASPFGNSFARPAATTGFGTPQQSTSLFGAQPATGGGLFGAASAAPAFGQTQSTPQTGFAGFQSQPNTSVFGANTATQNTSLFGQAGTTAFGAAKPATTGFGGFSAAAPAANTSIFGSPATASTGTGGFFGQQATPSTSLFGAPAATNSFGAATVTPLGGAAVPGATGNGTAIAKYQPLIGTDTLMKNNTQQSVTTNQHCITAMKEYENSSLEELRFEDYAANRKGPQAGAAPGGGLFGAPSSSGTGLFGAPATQQTSAFGQTENKGLFGQQTNTLGGFGQTQSAFGATATQNNNMFKGFGTPATSAPAFGFNNTATNNTTNSMFKGFGQPAAPSTGLFGSTPATGTSVFGQPATSTPAFGSTFGQTNTAPTTSIFGAPAVDNKSAFGQPATSTGFSFGQTANTGGTGLFGAPKPAENAFGAAPAFGAATSSAAPAFGAAQPTTSLFGNTFGAKPATSTPFTGFGQQPAAAPLGGSTFGTSTGGLFGNNSLGAKPGGLFGQPATNTAPSGGLFGGFGSNTGASTLGQSTLGGLGSFGAPAQPQQATVPIHQQILDMTANPYGDNPIFKDLKPAPSEESLRPTNPSAQKAVLEANAMQFKVNARVSTGGGVKVKPIGSVGNKNSLFDGLEEYDQSVDTFSMKPSAKRLNLKTKSVMSTEEMLNSSKTFVMNASDVVATTPRRGGAGGGGVVNKENEESFNNQIPRERPDAANETAGRDSWIQMNALEKVRQAAAAAAATKSSEVQALSSTIHELVPERQNRRSSVTSGHVDSPSPGAANTSSGGRLGDVSQRSGPLFSQNSSLDQSLTGRTLNLDETNVEIIDPNSVHPTGITLKRAGYYTIPSLDELCSYLSEDGSCWVNNFTIGREGYGNVYFNERMDVANLNLDAIVFFRNKEVVIYPIDDEKPPIGQGLNRKAQITLDQVWPTDKASHESIKDPERLAAMDYEAKLRRACLKHETRFIDYRPETGSWVFRVDHFSKYGLSDSDDEDEDVQGPKKPKMVEVKKPGVEAVPQVGAQSKPAQSMTTVNNNNRTAENRTLDDLDMEDDHFDGEFTYTNRRPGEVTSPSSAVASGYGVDAHKLQLMKASFFVDDHEGEEEEEDNTEDQDTDSEHQMLFRGHYDQTVPNTRAPFSSQYSSSNPSLAESAQKTNTNIRETFVDGDSAYRASIVPQVAVKSAPPLVIRPKIHEVRPSVVLLPEQMSQMRGKTEESCFADLSLLFGRRFKIGFGGKNKMTFVATARDSEVIIKQNKMDMSQIAQIFGGRVMGNLSGPVVANIQISTRSQIREFPRTVTEHLKIQLNFSKSSVEQEGGCPLMTVAGGTSLLLSHFEQAAALADRVGEGGEYQKYMKTVWGLCMALWGDDECLEGHEASSHLAMMRRRELVSVWLEEVVLETQKEARGGAKEDYLTHLLELLLAHKVVDACELAFANDDVNLALLLSQISGGPVVRQLIQHQLSCWQEVEADAFIDPNRLKAYMLVAGTPLLTSTHGVINVFSDVDWLTGLAIHLWYLCSPTLSVTDALVNYEQDFQHEDCIVAAPNPPHSREYRIESENPIQDIRFHLLKLYSRRSHRLEALLNPATHTADPMDFRLSWFLLQTLKTLGYRHCSPLSEAQLTTSFAEQLELHDLWQWAVFVMMHVENEGRRAAAVRDILNRSIRLNGEKECSKAYQEKEAFVIQELKVPAEWVYAAKAMRAGVYDRYHDQVKFYLKAKDWTMAHEVLMERIAPDCIINDDMEYLSSILKEFVDPMKQVLSWRNQGQILVDYITLTEKFEQLNNATSDEDLEERWEDIKPELTELCSRINLFPCPTVKHRLCQSEIAQKLACIVGGIAQTNPHINPCNLVRLSLEKLPLPPEYAQNLMGTLFNIFVNQDEDQMAY